MALIIINDNTRSFDTEYTLQKFIIPEWVNYIKYEVEEMQCPVITRIEII